MKKIPFLIAAFCFGALPLFSQIYADPNFPKPTSGYGADGTHQVATISYDHPYFSGEKIEIFHPNDQTAPVPTLFFCHGYGGTNSLYIRGMLQFVAKKGFAVVYVPYPTTGVSIVERYDILRQGFQHAARNHGDIIDTTKVGFVGHSFGGGALFGVANRCFTENNWGSSGRLLFALAPWYSFEISQEQLSTFPSDTKLIMQVYDEDVLNDHRMAIDIFKHINIPESEKDYILVQPDTINGYIYQAGHDLPGTFQVFDAMDYYAFYRMLDALCDYTFNGTQAAKNVALGNGSQEQVSMPGAMKPLVQTDDPHPIYEESKYEFNCSALINLRQMYCESIVGSSEIQVRQNQLSISPNPAQQEVVVTLPSQLYARQIEVLTLKGGVVFQKNISKGTETITIPTATWIPGMYIVRAGRYFGKLVIE